MRLGQKHSIESLLMMSRNRSGKPAHNKGKHSVFCPQGHNKDIVGRRPCGACAECARWANRISRQNPEIQAKHMRTNRELHWRNWGIVNEQGQAFSTVDYDRHYQIQQGKCKCCGKHQGELKQALKVEHDHATHKFRGLVCQSCNIKIGAVESKEYEAVKLYLGRN